MENILIIDDDPISLAVLSDICIRHGSLKVFTANTGKSGLEAFLSNPDIKLVITDFKLPDFNGDQIVKSIVKNFPLKPGIIMTSGIVSVGQISSLLENGLDYFLPKPINVKQLHNYINRILFKNFESGVFSQVDLMLPG